MGTKINTCHRLSMMQVDNKVSLQMKALVEEILEEEYLHDNLQMLCMHYRKRQ